MINLKEIDNKKIQSWVIFAVILLNIIAFILIMDKIYFRLDMTSGNKYSVSKPTVELLKNLDNTMVIEYYYSVKCKEHTLMSKVVQYVEDMLQEYESRSRGLYSKGNVNVIINELSYDNPEEMEKIDALEKQGVQLFPLSEREEGESKTSLGFSAIFIKYKGKERLIPVIYSDKGFEYLLDKEIQKLIRVEQTALGVIVSTADLKFDENFTKVKKALEDEYDDVVEIHPGENIPKNVGTLLIIGGSNLTEYDTFEIDQFLMNGGKAFVALSGVYVIQHPQYGLFGGPADSPLFDMLSSYGITVNKDLVGDNDSYYPIQNGLDVYRYPIWPQIQEKNISKTHPAVSGLAALILFWPSSIVVDDKIKDKTQVLFHTTDHSWSDTKDFKLDLITYKYPVQESVERYDLACSFEGKLDSYFKDKPVPSNTKGTDEFTDQKQDSGETRLIVVGNQKFLEDNFMGGENFGLYFLMNSLDWMSNDNSLIAIRSKGKFARPLNKINLKEKTKIRRRIVIAVSTYVVPILFILFAIILFVLRYKANIKLKNQYNK